jgi:arylsulfatase A-like enzyme
MLERTFIVFTSDHGDLCGEHGRDNKGVPMEGSARVAFLLHAPGVVPPGTVVRQALGNVDFKPTILALMGVADMAPNEGRDASALFRTGRAPTDWKDIAFVRIGGGPKPSGPASDDDDATGAGWLGAFTRRYKFIVAPTAGPSFFDLENDPDELHNLFTAPAQRDTVRRLAGELTDYAKRFHDPHLASSRVKADLAWAVSASTEYVARDDSVPKPGKGKRKNRQK